jgi:hypothetical protein
MARSSNHSVYAFPVEVAAFLEVSPTDVRRMIDLDELPATRIPKAKRVALRIYLPDLHAWLLNRSVGRRDSLRDYPEFLQHFRQAAGKAKVERETE